MFHVRDNAMSVLFISAFTEATFSVFFCPLGSQPRVLSVLAEKCLAFYKCLVLNLLKAMTFSFHATFGISVFKESKDLLLASIYRTFMDLGDKEEKKNFK